MDKKNYIKLNYNIQYREMLTHHSRGLSSHFNWVSSVCDGHFRSVHDVQTGIQNPIVKLKGGKKKEVILITNV